MVALQDRSEVVCRSGTDRRRRMRGTPEGEILMAVNSFHDLFERQVSRLYATALNGTLVLPVLRRAASCPELTAALEEDLAMAHAEMDRLSALLCTSPSRQAIPMSITSLFRNCLMLGEYEELGAATRDAALIDLVRRVRHDQIAGLSSAKTWARAMRDPTAVSVLEDCLREEKISDERLDAVADQCCRRAVSCCENCAGENFCGRLAHA